VKINELIEKNGFISGAEFVLRNIKLDALLGMIEDISDLLDVVNLTETRKFMNFSLDPLTIAALARVSTPNIEAIPHFTARENTRAAFFRALCTMKELEINNMLLCSGDKYIDDKSKNVYDFNGPISPTLEMIKFATEMNNGRLYNKNLGYKTDFCIGVVANPCSTNYDLEIQKTKRKIELGAHFIQTQPIFDIKVIKKFMFQLEKEGIDVPVLAGVLPLDSYESAFKIEKGNPGIIVPYEIKLRIKENDCLDEGIEIAKDIAKELKNYVQGIHVYSLNNIEKIRRVLQ